MKVCPECLCNRFHVDFYKQEITCKRCGLVLEAPPEYGIIHKGFKFVSHRKKQYKICVSLKYRQKLYDLILRY